jgi:putative RecB family exonuclease
MTTYSHSRLATFENCPRQYYYQYVARIKVEAEEGIEAFLGSRVHDTLEWLYRQIGDGRLPTRDDVIGWYEKNWRKNYRDSIAVVRKGEKPADYHQVGTRCLQDYYDRHAPFDQSRTLGLERQVQFCLDRDGRYRLNGEGKGFRLAPPRAAGNSGEGKGFRLAPPRAAGNSGEGERFRLAPPRAAGNSGEGKGFGLAPPRAAGNSGEGKGFGLAPPRAAGNSGEGKGFGLAPPRAAGNSGEGERTREPRPHQEDAFETRESRLCDWCGFQEFCPVRKHLFRTEPLPPNRFLKDSGVKLINHFAALTAEIEEHQAHIAELDAERQEVVEALFAYAEREGLEVIVGSDCEGRVVEQTKIVLPTKGDAPDDYAELDRKLRRSPAWPQVSTIDVHKLRRIWKGQDDDPGRVRKMLEPFVSEAKETKFKFKTTGAEEEVDEDDE